MAVPILVIVSTLFAAAALFLLIRREIRLAREDVKAYLEQLFKQAHPNGYPSATAVVTPSPAPAPVEVEQGEPEPAPARSAVMVRGELPADRRAVRASALAALPLVEVAIDERRTIVVEPLQGAIDLTMRLLGAESVAAPPVPSTARTGTPVPPRPIDAVDARYQALCDDARGKGLAADHCCGGKCYGTDVWCECLCEGCERATGFAAQAEREITGPSGTDADPRKRLLAHAERDGCDATKRSLAREHGTGVLSGAIVGRLTLDHRVADAKQLARLFTETKISPPRPSDINVALELAAKHDVGDLAGALVRRLSIDGRTIDAQRLAVLCTATSIGTADDFGDLLPRA